MSETVEITIPVDAEAAQALQSPSRRAAAGRYISGLLKGGRARDLLEEAFAEAQQEARANGVTDADIDAELEAWRAERKVWSSFLRLSTLVSASFRDDSIPGRAFLRAVDAPNALLPSQEVEDEYRDVLFRPKFDRWVSIERRQRILDIITVSAATTEPTEIVRECIDPKDDKYLTLAAAGKADVIVSSDVHHLLSLHPWRGISILSPADFLALD